MVKTCQSNEKMIKASMTAVGGFSIVTGILLLTSPRLPFWQTVMRLMGDSEDAVTVVTPLIVVFGFLFVFVGILFLIRFCSRFGVR